MTPRPSLSRRQMLAAASAAVFAPRLILGQNRGAGPRLAGIEARGPLVRESTIAGHRLRDNVVPAHPNGWQLSRDRWMITYATRGFRGIDDDWSIVWQLRRDAPDGPVIREGLFKRTQDEWDAVGDSSVPCSMQHSHPVVFGVPRGALIAGRTPPHANVFAATWRRSAVYWFKASNRIEHANLPSDPASDFARRNPILGTPSLRFQAVEWTQFRLNARGDDIEIIQPTAILRQRGFESGDQFCRAPVRSMNAGFVTPEPFDRDCTEWIGVNHFEGGRIACCKFRFDPATARYEWNEMGPLLGSSPELLLFEGFIARYRDDWIIGARQRGKPGSAWSRTSDPFGRAPDFAVAAQPGTTTPRTAYVCADGVLRLFTGDLNTSYYANARDPLYSWDIDPDRGFAASNRRIVVDLLKSGVSMRPEIQPWADNCKLLPPQGRRQVLLYRVHASANDEARSTIAAFWKNHPKIIPAINAREKAACGCYYSVIHYSDDVPPMWRFG